jgi:hypothetical protein
MPADESITVIFQRLLQTNNMTRSAAPTVRLAAVSRRHARSMHFTGHEAWRHPRIPPAEGDRAVPLSHNTTASATVADQRRRDHHLR